MRRGRPPGSNGWKADIALARECLLLAGSGRTAFGEAGCASRPWTGEVLYVSFRLTPHTLNLWFAPVAKREQLRRWSATRAGERLAFLQARLAELESHAIATSDPGLWCK
jgi:hypothetical protein